MAKKAKAIELPTEEIVNVTEVTVPVEEVTVPVEEVTNDVIMSTEDEVSTETDIIESEVAEGIKDFYKGVKILPAADGTKHGWKSQLNEYREATEEELNDPTIQWEEKRLGRRPDPNSKSFQRKAELEARRAAGELKRGRPVDPNSTNAQKKAELEARRAEGAVRRGRPALDPDAPKREVKHGQLGRPANPESEAYKRRMELQAKKDAGELKLGRPKSSHSGKDELKPIIVDGRKLIPISAKPTGFYNDKLMQELASLGVE